MVGLAKPDVSPDAWPEGRKRSDPIPVVNLGVYKINVSELTLNWTVNVTSPDRLSINAALTKHYNNFIVILMLSLFK